MYSIIVNTRCAQEVIVIDEAFDTSREALDYIEDNTCDFSDGDKAVIIDWNNMEALRFFIFEEQIIATAVT